jgi:hypothetical protein
MIHRLDTFTYLSRLFNYIQTIINNYNSTIKGCTTVLNIYNLHSEKLPLLKFVKIKSKIKKADTIAAAKKQNETKRKIQRQFLMKVKNPK